MERGRLRKRWLGLPLRALVPLAVTLAAIAGSGIWLAVQPVHGATATAAPAAAAPVDSTAAEPAPPLAGRTLAGGTLDLADLRGSVVLVGVWAAWCAPCRQELPVLVAAERRLGPRGLRWVGLDLRDGARQARELLTAVGGDPAGSVTDPQGSLARRWQVRGVPETFVVDARGMVRAGHVGAVSAAWIDEHVLPLLPAAG